MPLEWLTNVPVWLDQWPLPDHKQEAARKLVQEQVQLGHLVPSNSPWNTPIFVIKKKSGKWRLLQDLRVVNAVMKPMGALQPGLPAPSAIPLNYQLLILDLKDCFFTIPLSPDDCEKFTFSIPTTDLQAPYARYHWKVLPQGMANSPTLCQEFVGRALTPFRLAFPSVYCIHYMDDILLAAVEEGTLLRAFERLQSCLQKFNLIVAPEKVQRAEPYEYLGYIIEQKTIKPQKIQIHTAPLKTLNDYQKLLGDINWIRSTLTLTAEQLHPLFDILKGDSNPASPRMLTEGAKQTLELVNNKLSEAQVTRVSLVDSLYLILLNPAIMPLAVLGNLMAL